MFRGWRACRLLEATAVAVARVAPLVVQAYAADPLRDSRHRTARSARDLADWLAWLELGGAAARTLDGYERYMAALLRDFPDKAFPDFTDGDLGYFLKGVPPKSRAIVKAAMNNWFKWGYRSRRIPGNPVDLLPSMRYKPERTYNLFSEADTEALCALPAPHGQLMTLLFWTGLRKAEARHLTGKRLDLERRQVVVKEGAKGSKSRVVPMIRRVEVAAWELRNVIGIGPEEYVWHTKPGGGKVQRSRPIGNTSFSSGPKYPKWWENCLLDAHVEYRNPHLTRHSFATRMRELGMAMDEIQRLLGHESIRTTADTYVHTGLDLLGDRMRVVVGDSV